MIERILPPSVRSFDTFDDPPDVALYPEEQAMIARAVEKRRKEFTTARYCARQVMEQLGVPSAPIPAGPRGEPRWPVGLVGSITHCAGYRAAAISAAPGMIGIDAEPNAPLNPTVVETISLPREREMLRRLNGGQICWDRLLFSAKESVYKAWYPLAGRWLDFRDALVELDPREGRFTARLLVDGPLWHGRRITGFSGRWMAGDGLVITAIADIGSASER